MKKNNYILSYSEWCNRATYSNIMEKLKALCGSRRMLRESVEDSIIYGEVFDSVEKLRKFIANPHIKVKFDSEVELVYLTEVCTVMQGRGDDDALDYADSLDTSLMGYNHVQDYLLARIPGKKKSPKRDYTVLKLTTRKLDWDLYSYEKKNAERVGAWESWAENPANLQDLVDSPEWEAVLGGYATYMKKAGRELDDTEYAELLSNPTIDDVREVIMGNRSIKIAGKNGRISPDGPTSRVKQNVTYKETSPGVYGNDIDTYGDPYIQLCIPAGKERDFESRYFFLNNDGTLDELSKEVYIFFKQELGKNSYSAPAMRTNELLRTLDEIDSSFQVKNYVLKNIAALSFEYIDTATEESRNVTYINRDLEFGGDTKLAINPAKLTSIVDELIDSKWR